MEFLSRYLKRFESLYRRHGASPGTVRAFQELVYAFYHRHGRDFPWRRTKQPYRILVSEFMLQQTQTSRVELKYWEFLKAFPSMKALASARRADVLRAWQGLGYNRRAVALHRTAQTIVSEYRGRVPAKLDKLLALPGVGPSTAAGIRAFAFGEPGVLLETNVRRVFIHHFFADTDSIQDREIIPLIEKTVDNSDPRNWYYALMDYGVYLVGAVLNPNRKSAHYMRQTPFRGSVRQLRGNILRTVLSNEGITINDLARILPEEYSRVEELLGKLMNEGFLTVKANRIYHR